MKVRMPAQCGRQRRTGKAVSEVTKAVRVGSSKSGAHEMVPTKIVGAKYSGVMVNTMVGTI